MANIGCKSFSSAALTEMYSFPSMCHYYLSGAFANYPYLQFEYRLDWRLAKKKKERKKNSSDSSSRKS